MRIGELAARTGITAKTIRFWESTGLLADPTRTPSGYRDYRPETIDRLEFIRHAQTAGLTLAEIRQVLAISDGGEPPCEHVNELIHQHLTEFDHRIRELTETRQQLRRLAQRAADQDPAACDGYCAILRPTETRSQTLPAEIAISHETDTRKEAHVRAHGHGQAVASTKPPLAPKRP